MVLWLIWKDCNIIGSKFKLQLHYKVHFLINTLEKGIVTVNENQMEILAERGQDFVWLVEQRNKKTYLKFNVSENQENVEYANFCCIKVGLEINTTTDTSE